MVPGPNFGEFVSKGKFERWVRCTSEGPEGATDEGPWGTARWLVKGCNDNRKKTTKPSWLVVVDETTTWAWTGQGLPHSSSVPRKPEPLGAEIKNLCDGESGFTLHVETQEAKVRMARKQRYELRKATTATTVRLAHKDGLDESSLREEDKVTRALVGGSWFASHETAQALLKELQVLFVGNVKTATAKCPLQQLRWDLAETARGDHVVCKLEGSDEFTVGWNDHHFKTLVATGGTTESGTEAKRKRQHDNGTVFYKHVKRPKVMENYHCARGAIDQHSGYRQGNLYQKFHKTPKWNRRCLVSILSSTIVGAYKAREHHFPPSSDSNAPSRITAFVSKAIGEIKPGSPKGLVEVQGGFHLTERTGTTTITRGGHVGRECAIQQRYKACLKNRAEGDKTRCRRTVWRCHYHPEVPVCPAGKCQCLVLHQHEQEGQI
jgi:hypothetical protein